jgi:hypothetical protein
MKKIVLISCVSAKLKTVCRAKDLYVSPLFRGNLRYADSLSPDQIFILSAKYGLLPLNRYIAPYDLTLNDFTKGQLREWANRVLINLRTVSDLKRDLFIFLAGNNYRRFLLPEISHYQIPMEGLSIGKQLHFLSGY